MNSNPDMSVDEALSIIKQFRKIAAFAILVLSVGTVFYHYVEKMTYLDALYFSTVSLTTVGYGDIAPKTSFGKLFTIFYLIIGIGIIAALLNIIVKRSIAKQEIRRRNKSKNDNNNPLL